MLLNTDYSAKLQIRMVAETAVGTEKRYRDVQAEFASWSKQGGKTATASIRTAFVYSASIA